MGPMILGGQRWTPAEAVNKFYDYGLSSMRWSLVFIDFQEI